MIWDDNGLIVIFGESHFQMSQMAILTGLAGAAGILFLVFLYLQFMAPGRGGACRWRRARDHRMRPPFRKWRCRTCLVEAYSTDRRPPKECKKGLKSGV